MEAAPKKNPNLRGRPKGALCVKTKIGPKAKAIAERLGVDPFEILLHFANGNWKALGYEERTHLVPTKDGSIEVDNIEPHHRVQAASAACPYLFPKLASVAITDAEGKNFMDSFAMIARHVLSKNDVGQS